MCSDPVQINARLGCKEVKEYETKEFIVINLDYDPAYNPQLPVELLPEQRG